MADVDANKMKYQLVLQFPIDEHSDFDALIDLEDRLLRRIGENHIVDGHDFGVVSRIFRTFVLAVVTI